MNKLVIVIISCLFFLSSCKEKIEGTWVRQGDELQGMRVKIVKDDKTMYGVITQNSDKDGYFELNETKWNNIKKVGIDRYEGEDLTKGYGEAIYTPAHIKIQGEMLTIDWFVNNGRATGYHQIWTKLKD